MKRELRAGLDKFRQSKTDKPLSQGSAKSQQSLCPVTCNSCLVFMRLQPAVCCGQPIVGLRSEEALNLLVYVLDSRFSEMRFDIVLLTRVGCFWKNGYLGLLWVQANSWGCSSESLLEGSPFSLVEQVGVKGSYTKLWVCTGIVWGHFFKSPASEGLLSRAQVSVCAFWACKAPFFIVIGTVLSGFAGVVFFSGLNIEISLAFRKNAQFCQTCPSLIFLLSW